MAKSIGRSAWVLRMTMAGRFMSELRLGRRNGDVSPETEQRLKHTFRALGWDAPESILRTAVGSEIARIEHEASMLRKFRTELFGEG